MKVVLICFLFFNSALALSKVKLESIDFYNQKTKNILSLALNKGGVSKGDIFVRKNMIQLTLKDVVVWPKMDKQVSVLKELDSTVSAYQYDNKTARIRIHLPFSIEEQKAQIKQNVLNNIINIEMPKKSKTLVSEKSDEEYLEALVNDLKDSSKKTEQKLEDRVQTAQAAPVKKKPKETVSFLNTMYKFIGVFAGILGVFFFAIYMFKKFVSKSSKFNFLNDTKMIQILSKTYISPKRSFAVVGVGSQAFLVAINEKDVQFLSEVKDVPGMVKQGEKNLVGNNFDDFMEKDGGEEKVVLKKDITQSAVVESSISDKIRDKMKSMKRFN